MIKKVVIVVSLFLCVDRFMYYKLGQTVADTAQIVSTAELSSSHHKAGAKKKSLRSTLLRYAKRILPSQIS